MTTWKDVKREIRVNIETDYENGNIEYMPEKFFEFGNWYADGSLEYVYDSHARALWAECDPELDEFEFEFEQNFGHMGNENLDERLRNIVHYAISRAYVTAITEFFKELRAKETTYDFAISFATNRELTGDELNMIHAQFTNAITEIVDADNERTDARTKTFSIKEIGKE